MSKVETQDAVLQLAASQLELGQWRAAAASYRRLLKHSPQLPEALYGLARVAAGQGRLREQRRHLEQLCAFHPGHLDGALALAELQGHEPERALGTLERALEHHPRELRLLLPAARLLLERNAAERAALYVQQALAQSPQTAEWLLQLARLQLRLGELSAAAHSFERALALDSQVRSDARWIDLDGGWQQLTTRLAAAQLEALHARLTHTPSME
ncbi:MAG: tetratricopeptide repeat protein [Candidatus Sericytochromatia bacterium]